MASIGMIVSIHTCCSSQHVTIKESSITRPLRSNIDGLKSDEQCEKNPKDRFYEPRWKNGTWDLNMFVKNGRIDWEGVIVAGRAAMVGFFAAYFVDVLTGLNMVGQTGNFICKVALFAAILGVLLVRKKEDVESIRKLVDEATFYDKQWQSSWRKAEEE